jgi:hypothetical protein
MHYRATQQSKVQCKKSTHVRAKKLLLRKLRNQLHKRTLLRTGMLMQAPKHKAATSSITDWQTSFIQYLDYVLCVYFNAVSTHRTDSKKNAAWDGLGLICDYHFNFYHQVNNKLCYCLWQISKSTSLNFNHLDREVLTCNPVLWNASLLEHSLTLILRRSRTGTVWFYTSTSNKRAARPKLYKKSLTRDLKRMYSGLTLVRISINL